MNRRIPILARVLPALAITGCASVGGLFSPAQGGGSSLGKVDALLDHIERVHIESVLCRQRMGDALEALHTIIAPDFGGDALESFALFMDAVDRSEQQARVLNDRIMPMKQAAKSVFATWNSKLEGFANEGMRRHSEGRLQETRDRYDELLEAVEPARDAFEKFNGMMRDHALFLGHDFNASAVAELEREVGDLTMLASKLDGQFEACQRAALAYVQSTALRGQVDSREPSTRIKAENRRRGSESGDRDEG